MTPLEYVYIASVMLGGGYLALASVLHMIGGDHDGDGDAHGGDLDAHAGGVDVDAGGVDADVDGLDAHIGDVGGHDLDLHGDVAGHDLDLHGGGLDVDHGDLDAHADHAADPSHTEPDVSFFSPLVMSTLLFSFGVMGFLVDHWLTELAVVGLAAAAAAAAVGGGGVWWGLNRLHRLEGSSETRVRTLLGHGAEVSVAIPASGFGEIVYVHNQSRCNAPARSRGGIPIPRGARVLIGGIEGTTFWVEEARADRIRRLAQAEAGGDDGDEPGRGPRARAARNSQRGSP